MMNKIDWCKELGWGQDHLEELRNTGYSYIRQGKYDIALPFFQALIVLDRNNPYDAQTLGAIYIELNEGLKAIKYLDRALQLDSDHSPTLLNLAKAFFMVGKIQEGIRLANILKNDENSDISSVASALLLAYS